MSNESSRRSPGSTWPEANRIRAESAVARWPSRRGLGQRNICHAVRVNSIPVGGAGPGQWRAGCSDFVRAQPWVPGVSTYFCGLFDLRRARARRAFGEGLEHAPRTSWAQNILSVRRSSPLSVGPAPLTRARMQRHCASFHVESVVVALYTPTPTKESLTVLSLSIVRHRAREPTRSSGMPPSSEERGLSSAREAPVRTSSCSAEPPRWRARAKTAVLLPPEHRIVRI